MTKQNKGNQFQDLADSLAQESLVEAAEHFFGQRVEIENRLQDFWNLVAKLLQIQKQVQARQADLHFLLRRGEPQTVQEFYSSLGLDPEQIPGLDPEATAAPLQLRLPFALTSKGRYCMLLCRAYERLADQVHSYIYGEYYNDPHEPRCKCITANYNQLQQLSSFLQEKIRIANQADTYTEVLQFAKRLDVEREGKESLAGVRMQHTLDQELAFTPPELSQTGLKPYPYFPPLSEVQKKIKLVSARIYSRYPAEVRAIMQEIQARQSRA
ncbi:MAG: hypothetical protein ACOC43_14625 [Desulfohalobiaceae bacterium]